MEDDLVVFFLLENGLGQPDPGARNAGFY